MTWHGLVCYVAHPIGAPIKEGVAANLARAKRWLRFLQKTYPERAFIAPYLDWIEICGDDDGKPEERERGLLRGCAVAAHCDEFWPVGCGVEGMTKGMTRELGASGRVCGHYLSFVEPPEAGIESPPSPIASHRQWSSPWRHLEVVVPLSVSVSSALSARAAGVREGAAEATRFVEHRYACVKVGVLQHVTSIWLPDGVTPPSYVACSIDESCGPARKEYYGA